MFTVFGHGMVLYATLYVAVWAAAERRSKYRPLLDWVALGGDLLIETCVAILLL